MDEESKECRKEDRGPVFGGFVTENNDGKRSQQQLHQQQSVRIQSGLTNTVPSSVKESNFCADWKIPPEQVEAILQPSLSAAEARVTLLMQQFVESIESKILSALKQASMDIIENLGKEAAMRVLVAERKSVFFEQELMNTKQEALTMLVRLKQTMDAQIIEAERACQIERRRTQEMETKVMSLQDTVKKLKVELKKKEEVLEKQKIAQPLDEHHVFEVHLPSEYSMQVMSSTQQSLEQISSGKPYMPSIIMKSRGQVMPANEYNSGIEETINESIADALLASEGNDNKECISIEDDLLLQSVGKRHVTFGTSHQGQTIMPDVNSSQKQNAGCFPCQSALLITCTGQTGSGDGGLVHKEGKPSWSSESDASLRTEVKSMVIDKGIERVGNEEKRKKLASHPEIYSASFLPQDSETKTWGSESSKTGEGDEKPATFGMENLGMPFDFKDPDVLICDFDMHVKENDRPKDDCRMSSKHPNDVINVQAALCRSYANSSIENDGIMGIAGNQVASEDGVLTGTFQSDDGKSKISVHSDTATQEFDMCKPSPKDSKSSPGQTGNNDADEGSKTQLHASRPTMFTFQRKRRRQSSLLHNGNLVQEERDPKGMEAKQHDCFPNAFSGKLAQKHRTTTLTSPKSSLVTESSRDSRRLMQGARQLVLMSEKKSWC